MMQIDDKKLWSIEAEAAVLGSVIIDGACLAQVLSILPDRRLFFAKENQLIFQAVVNLHNTNGQKIDAILLRDELKKQNRLEQAGGVKYIAKILDSVPSSANAEHYARIVLDRFRFRELIDKVERMQRIVSNTDTLDEQLRKIHGLTSSLDTETSFLLRAATQPIIKSLSDVTPLPIHWFWFNRIPLGMLTMLIGDPGLGKTFLALDMAARVSRGGAWPDDGTPDNLAPKGGVIILTAEDDLAHVIRPRLDALGADVSKIIAIEGVKIVDDDDVERQEYFNLQRDLPALRQAIQKQKDTKLVIIDPLSAYLGKTDSHRDSDVRSVLAPLAAIAEEFNVAVITIRHLNKSGGGKAIYRGLGSIAFTAAARTEWLLTTDPDDPQSRRRLLTPSKHNILIEPTGLAFELVDGKVVFENEPVTITSDEALQTTTVEAVVLNRAVEWLKELLPPGKSLASTEVALQAKNEGITESTLRRAKRAVGAKSFQLRDGGQNKWFLQID